MLAAAAAASHKPTTICIITPDVHADKRVELTHKIKEKGYEITEEKEVTLTKEQAHEIYKSHEQSVRISF